MSEQKRCVQCGNNFSTSSNHKSCPNCRLNINKCIDCGAPIRREAVRCRACTDVIRGPRQIGKNNPNWKNGVEIFSKFVRSAKRRDKDTNLDTTYLKSVYDGQEGICPFTGIKMNLPKRSRYGINGDPYKASLDRIDNAKGYRKGNVRFVSYMANIARSSFTDEQLIEFCRRVVAYTDGKTEGTNGAERESPVVSSQNPAGGSSPSRPTYHAGARCE